MVKNILIIMLISLSSLSAQTFSPSLVHPLNKSVNQTARAENDINILAVLVDFQPDDFDLTYGDGTFGSIYSEDYGNDILDPLPHNASYFENHLQFASNYYSKVSNGKVNIDYTVLPEIITVSKPMREYSPIEGESFLKLADFSKEVWETLSSLNLSVDYTQYNLFVIFHAGVGKDISTNDLFGEARDLPSIYLGEKTLESFYGESFDGFQLNDGSLVKNTIILPETESREETGIGGVALLQLSINGLIVSSIASHLGLPDLFDAETGKSAIGRFGLMDGQSLFAFGGLFPPQPSAWEKIFLGWEEPIVIDDQRSNILVTVSEIANENDQKIIKIPINSTEYYLVENRTRDANDDGATITYKTAGQVRTINFTEDLNNFNNAFVDTLKGVVLNVDEFDWAVPGNGLLIWHIDEKIINAGLEQNRVNVGAMRGVDLEEADGIQDIGEEFQTIFGDIIIAEGDEFDFWFSSNSSKLYENIFGPNTKPNTATNSGANSLITISNFTDISNQMKFDVDFQSERITLVQKYQQEGSAPISNYKIFMQANELDGYFTSAGTLHRIGPESFTLNNFSDLNYALLVDTDREFIFGAIGDILNIAVYSNGTFSNRSFQTSDKITAPIVIKDNSNGLVNIYVGLADGKVEKYLFNTATLELPTLESSDKVLDGTIDQLSIIDGVVVGFGDNIYFNTTFNQSFTQSIKKVLTTKDQNGNAVSIVLTSSNEIYTNIQVNTEFNKIYSSNAEIENIVLADLKNDGENYIVFNKGNQIIALNLNGSSADQFPFISSIGEEFRGFPLIADLDDDGFSDIISTTNNGSIFAVSGESGKLLNEFPLSIGGLFDSDHSIIKTDDGISISAVNENSDFYFWNINSNGKVQWGSEFGNNSNSSSSNSAESSEFISEYFPKNRTYNWPNPVYGTETNIRTYVSEDSQVKVRVFDLAGDLVDQFEFQALGGFDTEYVWNVSSVQSGAYLAHLEVKSNNGKTESKIIKIAVVK